MKTFKFTGSGFEYFKIWIVNILLTIITLGIYYPWAKVRNNRYLYANSILEEKNFEYHATGKQLFFGYLIAVGLFILYKVLENFFPIESIILLILFVIIIPWLIWRSMKFNLNVTSFNNVRFKFDGKLKKSYIIFLALPIIFILIFGLIAFFIFQIKHITPLVIVGIISLIFFYMISFSYFNIMRTRYLIDFTNYGNASFQTNINTKEYLKIILKTILISITTLIVTGVIIAVIFYLMYGFTEFSSIISMYKTNPELVGIKIFTTFLPLIIISYFLTILVSIISLAYYITRQRKYIFGNTKLNDKIQFNSTMKFVPYAFILVSNFLLTLITLGLAYPWAKVRIAKYTLNNTALLMDGTFDGYFSENIKKESAIGEEIGDTLNVEIGMPF
jgi:uncharacterized membrane protein YjgN (DUF898 family)